jgi:hypothetical protein
MTNTINIGRLESDNFQNDREKVIAKNIDSVFNKQTFAILGNIHAAKKKISFSGVDILPTGFILKTKYFDKLSSIQLNPLSGQIYSFTKQTISKNEDFSEYADFTFNIDVVRFNILLL